MNIALVVIIYIAAVLVLLNPFSKIPVKRNNKKTSTSDPYHAISLNGGVEPCPQMAGLGDRRYLVGDVPELPLQQCPSTDCSCFYVHHEDRRTWNDRRLDADSGDGRILDRRGLIGRRKSDWSQLAVTG